MVWYSRGFPRKTDIQLEAFISLPLCKPNFIADIKRVTNAYSGLTSSSICLEDSDLASIQIKHTIPT